MFVAGGKIAGKAAVPVVLSEGGKEGVRQLCLTVIVKSVFGLLAVDEHRPVAFVQAQKQQDAVSVCAKAEAVIRVVEDLRGHVVDVATAIGGVVVERHNVDAAATFAGKYPPPLPLMFPIPHRSEGR